MGSLVYIEGDDTRSISYPLLLNMQITEIHEPLASSDDNEVLFNMHIKADNKNKQSIRRQYLFISNHRKVKQEISLPKEAFRKIIYKTFIWNIYKK